jgi:hypothetical protein
VQNASPVLNEQLPPTAEALVDFQEAPGVINGLELLTDTNRVLKPSLTYIVPSQTVCHYWSLTFHNIASAANQGNSNGNWLQFISYGPPEGPNSESTFASAPADEQGNRENHLHYNPLPRTAAPGQDNVCEAGNEKYIPGQTKVGHAPLWGTTTNTGGEE